MLSYLVRRSLRPRYTEIATEIFVGNEWQEFRCEKPAKPRGSSQIITLAIPGYSFDYFNANIEIRLADGQVVLPRIEVVDSTGNAFETKDCTRVGSLVGFHILPNKEIGISLGDDPQNVTVRIRSEVPFECNSIRWMTKRLK